MDLLIGTLVLRPYVFLFMAAFLVAGARDLGLRRTLLFGAVVWPIAWAAEWSSIHVGIPFGLYHYTGLTRGQELYVAGVPFFDSLSFTFLAYAAYCLARLVTWRWASPIVQSGPSAGFLGKAGEAPLRGLRRLVPDLVEVAGAVGVQAWPPAEAAEVPGLEALTMIGSRRSVDLRSVAGDEHEAPATRRSALHVDVNDVVLVHGLLSFHPDRHGRRYVRLRASAMPDRKPLIFRRYDEVPGAWT
jgi:hypothetical protein